MLLWQAVFRNSFHSQLKKPYHTSRARLLFPMEVLIWRVMNRKDQSVQWPGSVLSINFVFGKCPTMRQCNLF